METLTRSRETTERLVEELADAAQEYGVSRGSDGHYGSESAWRKMEDAKARLLAYLMDGGMQA